MMSEVEKIEKAVSHLSRKDLARFRAWYDEFEAKVWDRQFEDDVQAGVKIFDSFSCQLV